ncbi:MAG: nucleotidyl transferase AbiEii/AbiGii toxin family protein [Myxococcota bacterium]
MTTEPYPPTTADLLTTPRLSAPQRRFLASFVDTPFRRRFYLSGGAALSAGWLGHRPSDDLDFFSPSPVPIKRLIEFMKALPGLSDLQWLLPRERTTFMVTYDDGSQAKVEYRHLPFAPLAERVQVGPLYLDSLPDLLANKCYALVERRYELDRVDIYAILQHMGGVGVREAFEWAEAKFDVPATLLEPGLAKLRGAPPLEIPQLTPPLDVAAMTTYFEAHAR